MNHDDDLPRGRRPLVLAGGPEGGRQVMRAQDARWDDMPPRDDRDEDGPEISLRDYLRVLSKRRWQVVAVAAAILAAAVVHTLLDTPLYRSTAVLQVENTVLRVVKTEGLEAEVGAGQDFLTTQVELLKSRNVAARTVRELSLVSDQAFQQSLQVKGGFGALWAIVQGGGKAAGDQPRDARPLPEREAAAIDAVMRGLTVTPRRGSRLVDVSYASTDARVAERVVSGIARTYMQANLDRRVDNTQFARSFLEDRLQQVKQKLEDSERSLIAYSQEQDIVNVDDYSSIAAQNLAQLSTALSTAQAARIAVEAKAMQARETGGASVETLNSPVLETLRQKRVELQAQYESKRALYKPEFPEMLQLQRQIREVEAQITSETAAYSKATDAELRAARTNEQLIAEQIATLRAEVLDLEGRGIQYNILKREADTNRQLYDALLQRYKEIGVAGDVGANNISLVDAALPGMRFKPDWRRNLAFGLFIGLLAGIALALLLEKLDDTLKTPEDVERLVNMPVVGIVPKIPEDVFDDLVADPKSSFNEAYRSLRTSLQYSTEHGAPRVLLVTSAVAGEGKSTTAANLAKQFALLGQRVLLVDTDLRKPSIHKQFGLTNEHGLTDYLTEKSGRAEILQAAADAGIAVITSGERPPNPAELLALPRFQELLEWAAQEYDQVVVDCAPLLGLADVPTIARLADGVLLVIEAGSTGVGVVRATLKRLAAARAHILGTVLVQFDSRNTGYGYGYGYHYADHYYYYSAYGAYGSNHGPGGEQPVTRRRRVGRD